MEVHEHIVALPAANHLDDVDVYSLAEDLYGTSIAEGAGVHILGFKS